MPPHINQFSFDKPDPSLLKLEQELKFLHSIDTIDTSANHTNFPDLIHDARGSCGDCSQFIRVQTAYELSRGQHIRMPGERTEPYIPSYTHHSVVTHAVAIDDSIVEVELVHMSKYDGSLQLCRETKTYDLQSHELYVIHYYHPRYTREQVAKRAENTIKNGKTHFSDYNLATTNCEHFATWCVVGETNTYKGNDWVDDIIEGLCKRGYSQQVTEWVTTIIDAIRYIFGDGSKAMHFMKRFLLESSDEICCWLGNIMPDCAKEVLTIVSVIYTVYCITYTVYLSLKKKNGYICKCCYDKKIAEMWSKLSIYGNISAATFFLAGGVVSFPVVISCLGLIILSVGLQYFVPNIRKLFLAPNCCTKKIIDRLSELEIADIVTIPYYGLPHDVLVTGITVDRNGKDGRLQAIHYATDSIFSKRTIREESFNLSIWNTLPFWQIKRHECRHLQRYEPEISVSRARKRIGETKWNPVSNRSDHVCYWAKVRGPVINEYKHVSERIPQNNHATQNHRQRVQKDTRQHRAHGQTSLSFGLIGEFEVHLSEEIEIGDVIRYEGKESFVIDKAGNDRIMNLRVIFVTKDRKEKGIRVNLNIKTVQVLSFLPTICFDKPTRAENAVKFKREAISEEIFKRKCILKIMPI